MRSPGWGRAFWRSRPGPPRGAPPLRCIALGHGAAGLGASLLGGQAGSPAGAIAAQLNRARARLRVEYLLALERTDPPSDRCRPVLLALSGGDRGGAGGGAGRAA